VNDQLKHYEDKLRYEIDSSDLDEALRNGQKIVVIDTRSPELFRREHISGALSLPHREMNEKSTAKLDKKALIVTYCSGIGCNGSTKGALNMAKLGFNVKELVGGIEWWKKEGYKTS
jgi:rhodanese-related sulfurtransferase